ncbi:MAG: hypothetical protein LBV03_09170 [Fusobacteriales bacterium]|jgi:ABC-type Fe3+-citrate transport system substrate-binding protein|nr:hypothetical protein [Fusobacteriales bacterium]
MNKEKLNRLYNKSKKIADIMKELNKTEYKGYKLKISLYETFLSLDDTFISNSLKSYYSDENLSDFMPATKINIMQTFENDIKNNLFEELENQYFDFQFGSESNGK